MHVHPLDQDFFRTFITHSFIHSFIHRSLQWMETSYNLSSNKINCSTRTPFQKPGPFHTTLPSSGFTSLSHRLSQSPTVSHCPSQSLMVSHGHSWRLWFLMVLRFPFSLSLTVSHCLSWSLMVTHGVSGFSWSFRVYPHGLSSCFVFMSSCTTCECEREYSQPSQPLTC